MLDTLNEIVYNKSMADKNKPFQEGRG